MNKNKLAKELFLPAIVLFITAQLAIPLFYSMFMTDYPQPISIQQYRGAGAMGIVTGMCLLGAFYAVNEVIESISRYRSGLNGPYAVTWSNEGEKLLSELQEKSKMSLGQIMNAALTSFAEMVDQEHYMQKIRTQMAKKPRPDFIKIVIDNTKKDDGQ